MEKVVSDLGHRVHGEFQQYECGGRNDLSGGAGVHKGIEVGSSSHPLRQGCNSQGCAVGIWQWDLGQSNYLRVF